MYQQQYTSHNPVNINGTVNSLLGFYFENLFQGSYTSACRGFPKKDAFFQARR
jgi:hypothetical protein|tara:strand:+ start:420 stop:578 length:159 start_codon:yes stop_codon:yes gene_type:complete